MSTLLTFGEYVGTDVRDNADADRNYCVLVDGQPWFKAKYPWLSIHVGCQQGDQDLDSSRKSRIY